MRAAVVAVALLALLAGWFVTDRVRDVGTVTAEPGAVAGTAALTGQRSAVTAEPARPVPALPPAVSATAPAGKKASASRRPNGSNGGQVSRSRPNPDLPALPAVTGGAQLAGRGGLSDVLQDQGAGVLLPNGDTMWFFADTVQTKHDPYFFVTSSAAVTQRGSRTLSYASDGKGTPIEFLARTAAERAGQSASRYTAVWPTGATRLPDGRILVGYAKYDVVPASGTYTFLGAGVYEYRYPGPAKLKKASPARRISSIWSPADGVVGSPLYADGFVYFSQCENLECYSVRTPVSGIADRAGYSWYTGSGWSHDRARRTPMTYGDSRPGRNPSTVHLPEQGVYGVVDTAAGAMSAEALLWVSPNPYGPWSRPAKLTLPNCPYGCYTLNLHPGQSPAGAVRISYATKEGPHVRVTDVAISVPGNGSGITARPL